MTHEELIAIVNSKLAPVFEKNNLNLVGASFDPERHYSVAVWKNNNYILEIYSDPMGGEINCRIKELSQKKDEEWKYIYELIYPTAEELKIAYGSMRSENEQLNSILVKLRRFLEG